MSSMKRFTFLSNFLFSAVLFIYPLNAVLFGEISGLSNVLFSNKCIEDLGCFYTGRPFYDPLYRPISLPPTCHLHTKFLLYTRSNPDEEYNLEISEESLQESPFDPDLPTKILVHGFLSDLGKEDVRHPMRKALLKQSKYNVIVVDWTKDNGLPYTKAIANARPTGAKLAKLINFLINNAGITAESVHIIATSLGAHLAGYAGERVKNLGRITGLDPALMYFSNTEPEVRLDPSDALFVDVIHTSSQETVSKANEYLIPIGHQDFYPNGGRFQPVCVDKFGDGRRKVGSCSHIVVNDYFTESIESDCKHLGVLCNNYQDYENGLCSPENSSVAEMGFHATKIPGLTQPTRFFLNTARQPPFCNT